MFIHCVKKVIQVPNCLFTKDIMKIKLTDDSDKFIMDFWCLCWRFTAHLGRPDVTSNQSEVFMRGQVMWHLKVKVFVKKFNAINFVERILSFKKKFKV